MRKILMVLFVGTVLSACKTLDLSELGLPDFSNSTTKPGTSKTVAGKNAQVSKQDIIVNVDVDTAAARLKRKYGFMSEEEVSQLNNGSSIGGYREAAAREGKYVWTAQPGSSYKMGRDMTRDVSMQLEVVKDGRNRSKIYATFWHKNYLDVNTSMAQVKAGAEGK